MRTAVDFAHRIAEHFEGCILTPYHDPVGFPTIGWGHLLSREPWADLSQWEPLTQAEADALLDKDLARFQAAVRRLIHVPLTPQQEGALIDFAFNCGAANLQASTLRRVINRGDLDEAPKQFLRWVYARGQLLRGLRRRRAAEVELWNSQNSL